MMILSTDFLKVVPMKIKAILILLLSVTTVNSNPIEVAQNVFQEFRQVQELIEQFREIERQIEEQQRILESLSGIDLHQLTTRELELLILFPQSGDEILEPTGEGEYTQNYNEIKESYNFIDPEKVYNIEGYSFHEILQPRAIADKKLQQSAIAGSAYHKTWMDSLGDRVQVVTDYLNDLSMSETMKESVDIEAQMTAQAVLNQIEINKTMSMLLQLESARTQQELTVQRANQHFIRPEIFE